MSDWDFHPLNVFIITVAAVTVIVTVSVLLAHGDAQNQRVKIERIRACSTVPDPAMRTLCIGQAHR